MRRFEDMLYVGTADGWKRAKTGAEGWEVKAVHFDAVTRNATVYLQREMPETPPPSVRVTKTEFKRAA